MNSATTTLALLAGAMVGAGIFLLVAAALGVGLDVPGTTGLGSRLRTLPRRILAAAVTAAALLVLTRWVVLAAAGGCLVVVWPLFFGGAAQEREAAERIAALATWAESLRDTIAGAVGLEQAVPATVHAASPVIRDHLALLADRMRVRVPLPTALRQFADDLDDPTADLIVSALIMNARLRGPGLRSLLGNLAATARTELDMRQRVSASRAGTRRSAQIVIVFSILMIMGLALFNPGFVSPYDSAQGQVVLLVVVGLFAAGMMWMRRLAGIRLPRRFLTVTAPGGRSS